MDSWEPEPVQEPPTPSGHDPRVITARADAAARRQVRREIPTARQLSVRPTRILLRGCFARCPGCGGRHVFRKWFLTAERCPTCTLLFERVEGHWIGALGTNTVGVFGLMFVVLFGSVMVTFPEAPGHWLLFTLLGIALLGPLLLFPPSRMLWTAIDMLMRPLRPGEIDPRFVRHDPYRDRPKGP